MFRVYFFMHLSMLVCFGNADLITSKECYRYSYSLGYSYISSFYCVDSCCGSSSSRKCCYYYDDYYYSYVDGVSVNIGSIIGAVIGGIVGLILFIVLIVCVCAQCNKRTTHGAIVNPAQNQANVTMISSSQQQQQQQQQMYPGPAYPPSTSSYPPQPYQPQYHQGHPQPMPPPAYAENVVPGLAPYGTKE